MNNYTQECNIEFGLLTKENGALSNKNSLSKEALYQFACFRIFNNYNGPTIGMGRFVKALYENNWQVIEVSINKSENLYKIYSRDYNFILNLKLSTDLRFQESNKNDYQDILNILKIMSKGAKIQNNKIINLSDYNNKAIKISKEDTITPTKVSNIAGYRNLQTSKKAKQLFSKKQKIVLVTLTAAVTAIFIGGVINNAVNKSNENAYEQTYTESPVPNVSQETYNQSIRVAQERAAVANNNIETNSNQSYDAGILSNENADYYPSSNYTESPVPNVSQETYDQSIRVAQERQSYQR